MEVELKTAVGEESVKVLEEVGHGMRLVVSGVDSSFVNVWRRTMMGEVDVLAIDRLEIHQNTTMMHDELLFHRLGLIPLRCICGVDRFVRPYECDCDDGCAHCSVKFTLHVVNRSDETVEVTSKDLQSADPNVSPVRDDVLLVKLGTNQEIFFTAHAVKSTHRYENNAKWSPVTIASYRPTAQVHVNAELMNHYLTADEQRRVCQSEPGQVLQYNEILKCTLPHADASLRCVYSGDFIETLADILHPSDTGTDQDAKDAKDAKDEKNEKMVDGDEGGSMEKRRAVAVGLLEEANGKILRHPNQLVHPMISMIPRSDEFLCPVVTTGCMPPREVALKALVTLRKRLVAIQMLNRRRHFFQSTALN
jgi:DNA-directed RNA polymerase alpha subunit